jgi:UDP-N-acetylmuramoylalanine--D-glutamate ligase
VQLSGRNVVVIGLGRSGVASARLCMDRGAHVVASDLLARNKASADVLNLEQRGATLVLGSHDAIGWDRADLVVVSPGVPSFPALERFEKSGREVVGELELASRFVSAPIALIGGTNGKSTVTSWTGQMLTSDQTRTFVGGNLGVPLAEVVDQPWDRVVLEISSFQAERIPTLHARAAALLNITDDHLDRYPDFQAYAQAKGNMFVPMTQQDVAIIPQGDPLCRQQASRGAATLVTFGPGADVRPEGPWLVDSHAQTRYPISDIRLSGVHNQLNACASIALASAMGSSPDSIANALRTFQGLNHRTVFVTEVQGVRFYDDSKGTNVGASVVALRGLVEPFAVLIAGGRDKLGSYEPLVQVLRSRGRGLVVIGEAADRIAQAAAGVVPVRRAASMGEAVRAAFEMARAGDGVLLSPACASFDMFSSYVQRGEVFCESVKALASEQSTKGGRG